MRKETVVVFDGEDKFIMPRNKTYDIAKGVAYDASTSPDETKEGAAFKQYMLRRESVVTLPSPSDADFCAKIRGFISTNGEGKATPDDIMRAYQLFQDNCVEKPEQTPPASRREAPTPPEELTFPNWQSLDCDLIESEIQRLENEMMVSRMPANVRSRYENAVSQGRAEKQRKCQQTPPVLGSIDVPPPPPPSLLPTGVSLSTPTLGQPPKPKGGAAGGEEQKEREPNKGSNWLIWVLLGGAALYFLTRKRN